ncbi:MAG: hypothetical protein H0X62_12365 [Bacteroidetes bacterium]|nr:hypothetical protein [Bacteroidota bacterium]
MSKQKDIEEMKSLIKGLEGLRNEKDNYIRTAQNMDEYYFKVVRDRNNIVCKIVALKNHIDRLKKPRDGGIEPMTIPYVSFK